MEERETENLGFWEATLKAASAKAPRALVVAHHVGAQGRRRNQKHVAAAWWRSSRRAFDPHAAPMAWRASACTPSATPHRLSAHALMTLGPVCVHCSSCVSVVVDVCG